MIKEIRNATSFITNDARAIQRYIDSDDFEELTNVSDLIDELYVALNKITFAEVKKLIYMMQNINYEFLSLRRLRLLAKSLGIKYYSMKTKDELLTDIGGVYEKYHTISKRKEVIDARPD